MHTQCVANSGKHQRQPLNLVEHVCVCVCVCIQLLNTKLPHCHCHSYLTNNDARAIRIYIFLHYSLTDTRTQVHTHLSTQSLNRSIVHKAKCEFYHDSYYIFHYCLWYLWEKRVRSNMK